MTDLPGLSDISGKQDDHVSLTRGCAQNIVQYALCVLSNALQGYLGPVLGCGGRAALSVKEVQRDRAAAGRRKVAYFSYL